MPAGQHSRTLQSLSRDIPRLWRGWYKGTQTFFLALQELQEEGLGGRHQLLFGLGQACLWSQPSDGSGDCEFKACGVPSCFKLLPVLTSLQWLIVSLTVSKNKSPPLELLLSE